MNEQALYGQIDGIGIPVSRVFFGTAMAPVNTDAPEAQALLDRVLETGVNAFDCARSYGLAEQALGRWIRERGVRDRIVLLTKGGDIREGKVCVNRQVITGQLGESLRTLRTDHIDLYLLHRDDPVTPVAEIIDTLNEAQRAGKLLRFGASNWTHRRIAEANAYAAATGQRGFSVSSPNYGLAHQVADLWGGGCVTLTGPENADARAWYEKEQMPVIAYSVMARGFFSGRFRAGDTAGARQVLDPYAQKGYLCEENMEKLRRAEILAEQTGIPVGEVAMRYFFASPMNVFAVVSSSSQQRLRHALEAAASPLTAAQCALLDGGVSPA